MHDSADSLSTSSRRSSLEGNDKTLVVVINRRNKNMSLAQKQRSWETFPPKRRHHMCHKMSAPTPPMPPLRKVDSFEGESCQLSYLKKKRGVTSMNCLCFYDMFIKSMTLQSLCFFFFNQVVLLL